jgi:hypothetical protein
MEMQVRLHVLGTETGATGKPVPSGWPVMRVEQPSRAACLFGMDARTQYREFADVCERLAIQTKNEQHEKILREMAATWRGLAEKIERENDR